MSVNRTIILLFSLFQLATISNGATLTGSITDSAATPLIGVKVILAGLSNPTFIDSTLSGSNGSFAFDSITVATYRLSLRFAGFLDEDSSIVIGNGTIVCNFVLSPMVIPSGTLHSGIVSGTWIPSGNPHRIIDTAIIKDSLFIAPGCSLIIDNNKQLIVEGNLSVGSSSGSTSSINGGTIFCNDSLSLLHFSKTRFNLQNWSPLNSRLIVFDSCECPIGHEYLKIKAIDSIVILRTQIQGIPDSYGFHASLGFETANLRIENCLLRYAVLYINCNSSLQISYCAINRVAYIQSEIPKIFINHCNFTDLTFDNHDKISSNSDAIMNNIILAMYRSLYYNTVYTSPFGYNLIRYQEGINIFGLLANAQTNANGDSCDIWFNIHSDPLFADNTLTVLNNSSPAIAAASDGTNIGYYQGQGVNAILPGNANNFRKLGCKINIIYDMRNNISLNIPISEGEMKIAIYNALGRCVFSQNYQEIQKQISLPLGLLPGIYVFRVNRGRNIFTGKFMLF